MKIENFVWVCWIEGLLYGCEFFWIVEFLEEDKFFGLEVFYVGYLLCFSCEGIGGLFLVLGSVFGWDSSKSSWVIE